MRILNVSETVFVPSNKPWEPLRPR